MNNSTYLYKEIVAAGTVYFDGDEAAARIWADRYALRRGDGALTERSPDNTLRRLASEWARIEAGFGGKALSEDEIFTLIDGFRHIVPSGNMLHGIGAGERLSSLSNCFVVPSPADTMGDVMHTAEEAVQLLKRRGGVGIDLSGLRPQGLPIDNAAVASPGVTNAVRMYSDVAGAVKQNGRQGGLMLTLGITHPDAERFATAKAAEGVAENANLSLLVPDGFMRAVERGGQIKQTYPSGAAEPIITKNIEASGLWHVIVRGAHACGEPGLLFTDNIKHDSVAEAYADSGFGGVTTNPCGEVWLSGYESCRLMSLNLVGYVSSPFTDGATIDYDALALHARAALRLLDDTVELEIETIEKIISKIKASPTPEEIKGTELRLWQGVLDKTRAGRRVGVGITALADMIAALGLRYGSPQAVEVAERVARTIAVAVYAASAELAAERGAFPLYSAEAEKGNAFIERIAAASPETGEVMARHGRRNMQCLAIAPTGSISMLTRTSSGIEPIYKPLYSRRIRTDRGYDTITLRHQGCELWAKIKGLKVKSDTEFVEAVANSPYAGASAAEISPERRIRTLAAMQRWVDGGISITVNLPSDTTCETVSQVLIEAWRAGCKGITVYRDGSRRGVLGEADTSAAAERKRELAAADVMEHRPYVLECDVVRFQNNKEKWVALVGLLDGRPYEIFTGLQDDDEGIVLPKSVTTGRIIKHVDEYGNKRYDFQFENKRGYKTTVEGLSEKFNKEYWNYAKLISGVLRYRMPVENVIKLVSSLQLGSDNINTWKVGVERALKKYVTDAEPDDNASPDEANDY